MLEMEGRRVFLVRRVRRARRAMEAGGGHEEGVDFQR